MSLRGATMAFGDRVLWQDLDLDVAPGEFVAVLGPNGSGKSTLLKVILGFKELSAGEVRIDGRAPDLRARNVGIIPQQKTFPEDTPLRARDMVALGIDGHRWGPRLLGRRRLRERVDALLEQVGASSYADQPVGILSGGEQQRLRAAQALADDPKLLLCDEPLLSLDLHHQRAVSSLIHHQACDHGAAVLFVTHEINPVLQYVDRVVYLAGGRFHIGTVDEVMTSEVLSDLYDSPIEVFRTNGRIVVVGVPETMEHPHGLHAEAIHESEDDAR
ncbi:metal ABC transporter ATP-binding protein [Zhihengliuella sp.]|uniref:metal ABC transporter ATP-binding protein n=1 Tax=Zhihengliuella sp. TaxID=1954483 RepID=UPI002810A846|nr:metal ABC transporter ATP-binding protein [Zhihengliuella sp.]